MHPYLSRNLLSRFSPWFVIIFFMAQKSGRSLTSIFFFFCFTSPHLCKILLRFLSHLFLFDLLSRSFEYIPPFSFSPSPLPILPNLIVGAPPHHVSSLNRTPLTLLAYLSLHIILFFIVERKENLFNDMKLQKFFFLNINFNKHLPIAKVSVAKRTLITPSWKRISIISLPIGKRSAWCIPTPFLTISLRTLS